MLADLARSSRPFSWINTALPCLACGIGVAHRPTALLVLTGVYFLAPYNLLMYGVNDVYDYESDRRNPRKGGAIEGGVIAPAAATRLWAAVAISNLPFLVLIAVLGGASVTAALVVTVGAAVAYSAPPVRTKVIPGLDSITSSLHFVLPAVVGGLVAGSGLAALPWRLLAAFFLWGVASQALGAIQDIGSDRAAGIGSVAVSLGAHRTALLSLAGYAGAITLVASEGGAALAAAVALVPYTLLAASCLGGQWPRQARRAWRSFLGMNLLAGFVITQVLLRVWGTVVISVPYLLAWGSAIGAGACLAMLVLNRRSMRRRACGPTAPHLVSVVVAARNEVTAIGPCIRSLLAQDHATVELIVVDDASDDGTAEVAREVIGARGLVLDPGPPPPGWTGKCWAAAAGTARASGDVLVFVDADTTLGAHAIAALCAELDAQGGGMLSIVTRYAMETRGERVLMPAFVLVQTTLLPVALLNTARARPARLALAYGPCMVIDRGTYERTGGHGAIATSDREDLDLARLAARTRAPVRLVSGADLGETRHYRNAREVASCWRRTWFAYGGNSLAVALAGVLGIATVELLPLAMLIWAALAQESSSLIGGAAGVSIILVTRVLVARWERQPWTSILWHPITWLATIAFQTLGIADGVRGRVPQWRGRQLVGAPV